MLPPDARQGGAERFAEKQGVALLLGRGLAEFNNSRLELRDLSNLEPSETEIEVKNGSGDMTRSSEI